MTEDAKVSIRMIRRDANDVLKQSLKIRKSVRMKARPTRKPYRRSRINNFRP